MRTRLLIVAILVFVVGLCLYIDGKRLENEGINTVNGIISPITKALGDPNSFGTINADKYFEENMERITLFGYHLYKYEIETDAGIGCMGLGALLLLSAIIWGWFSEDDYDDFLNSTENFFRKR